VASTKGGKDSSHIEGTGGTPTQRGGGLVREEGGREEFSGGEGARGSEKSRGKTIVSKREGDWEQTPRTDTRKGCPVTVREKRPYPKRTVGGNGITLVAQGRIKA